MVRSLHGSLPQRAVDDIIDAAALLARISPPGPNHLSGFRSRFINDSKKLGCPCGKQSTMSGASASARHHRHFFETCLCKASGTTQPSRRIFSVGSRSPRVGRVRDLPRRPRPRRHHTPTTAPSADSFAAAVALDGNGDIVFHDAWGPPGARLLSRYALADDTLREHCPRTFAAKKRAAPTRFLPSSSTRWKVIIMTSPAGRCCVAMSSRFPAAAGPTATPASRRTTCSSPCGARGCCFGRNGSSGKSCPG